MGTIADRKLAWGFGLALTVLAANALISYSDLAELIAHNRHVLHTRDVLEQIEGVASSIMEAEASRRGYLIDGDPSDLAEFDEASRLALARIVDLRRLIVDHPDQGHRCALLERAARARLEELRSSLAVARDRGAQAARAAFISERASRPHKAIFALTKAIEKEEERRLRTRVDQRRRSIYRSFVTFSISSTLALILIGSIYFLLRRHLAERSMAERSLLESEATVRLLLDSAGEGVYGVDLDGTCTFCNPAGLQLLGVDSADRVLGRNMHDLIHHTRPDGRPFPGVECPIFRCFRTGEGTLGEEDIFWRADGTSFPVEYRAHPIRRGAETLGAVVTFVDVAPRLRAETEMRLRDRALKAIAQGIFITDPARSDEPIIYVNAAFERLTGYSQAEAAGRNIELLHGPGTDPRVVEELHAAFRDRREASVLLLSYRQDGSTFWDALTLAPVEDPDGRVTHFVGVVTDVTQRVCDQERLRDSEGRLRLMIESVRDYAIFAIDLQGRVSSWNPGAERLFGFADSEILGLGSDLLFSTEDRAAGIPQLELARAEATGRAADERWHRRKDGSRFFASGMVTAVRAEAGTLLGYTKVARDITEAKRAEAELRAAKEAAEVANRSKSSFLANMSHELRTPLNAIIGYSEMLEEEAVDRGLDDLIPDLDRIHSAGKHLLGLINDVLDLSKIEAGRMDLYLETFDVAEMIRGVLQTIEPLAEKAGNAIRPVLADDLGAMHADLTKVRQALLNLLSNAAKFTRDGTITLRAAREPGPDGRERLALSVEDDGIGMTPEEMDRLFRPFVQADASTTRRYGGTGLGLTITRRFCEMMGGEIVASSEAGRGSTFTIRLPADVEGRRGDLHAAGPPSGRPAAGSGTVLVIDDDPAVGDLMARVLSREGFRVEHAPGGELGLRKARLIRPDLITLDVMMPGMDGWSVLSALKADPELAEIPVIMVTFVDDKKTGYSLNASDYLTKPIDRDRLAHLLRGHRQGLPGGLALVVDDDPAARQMARQMLQGEGWSVVEAEDGRVGLDRFEQARPDLVILDLTMAGLDGFDFAAELRGRVDGRDVPILITMARDLSPEQHARLNGKVHAILQKGSSPRDELLVEVRRRVAEGVRCRLDGAPAGSTPHA